MWCCWICPDHDLGDAVWSSPPTAGGRRRTRKLAVFAYSSTTEIADSAGDEKSTDHSSESFKMSSLHRRSSHAARQASRMQAARSTAQPFSCPHVPVVHRQLQGNTHSDRSARCAVSHKGEVGQKPNVILRRHGAVVPIVTGRLPRHALGPEFLILGIWACPSQAFELVANAPGAAAVVAAERTSHHPRERFAGAVRAGS